MIRNCKNVIFKSKLLQSCSLNFTSNNGRRNYIHVDGCFNIEKMEKLMNNSSMNSNNNNKISMIKNLKGPLSLNDLEKFDENGYIIKSNLIDINNLNDNQLYESFTQLYQVTYSNSYKSNNSDNIEYSEYPNIYGNFSPTDLIPSNSNNNISSNIEKTINLDCNPFNLFRMEVKNKQGIIESVPLKNWIPIKSILSENDNITIYIIPKFHKQSIKYICDKYSKEKRNLSKNQNRSLDSTNLLYKHDKELLSKYIKINLKKGDSLFYDSRLPYSINSNNNNDINYSNLNYLPNISINK